MVVDKEDNMKPFHWLMLCVANGFKYYNLCSFSARGAHGVVARTVISKQKPVDFNCRTCSLRSMIKSHWVRILAKSIPSVTGRAALAG